MSFIHNNITVDTFLVSSFNGNVSDSSNRIEIFISEVIALAQSLNA